MDLLRLVLFSVLVTSYVAAKPTNHHEVGSTRDSVDYNEALARFSTFLQSLYAQFADDTKLKDNDVEAEDADNTHQGDNLLNHILDTIEKGHMTSENMAHWETQLHDMYLKGQISEDSFHDFLAQYQTMTHSDTPQFDHCCLFG